MTALASTDVTINEYPLLNNLVPTGNKRVNIVDIAFGDGSLTYPSGGVPLPAKDKFGMFEEIDAMFLMSPPGVLFEYQYDRDNHKIRIISLAPGASADVAEMSTSAAPAATTLRALVIGS